MTELIILSLEVLRFLLAVYEFRISHKREKALIATLEKYNQHLTELENTSTEQSIE